MRSSVGSCLKCIKDGEERSDWTSPAIRPGALSASTELSELANSSVCTLHGRTAVGKSSKAISLVGNDAGSRADPPKGHLVKSLEKILKAASQSRDGGSLSFGYAKDNPEPAGNFIRSFFNLPGADDTTGLRKL